MTDSPEKKVTISTYILQVELWITSLWTELSQAVLLAYLDKLHFPI